MVSFGVRVNGVLKLLVWIGLESELRDKRLTVRYNVVIGKVELVFF